MTFKPKKIFIGFSNIASQMGDFVEGFRNLNIETMTAVYKSENAVQSHTNIDYKIDAMLQKVPQIPKFLPEFLRNKLINYFDVDDKIWRIAIKECDTFLFMWSTFREDREDIRKLKDLGKKIIVFFVGDDIYWYPAGKQDFESKGMVAPYHDLSKYYEFTNLDKQLRYLRYAEKYADLIFTAPALSQLMFKKYMRGRHIIPLHLIKENSEQRKENPLVIFAPTNRIYKGMEFVMEAINRLQNEGIKFQIRFFENMKYEDALTLYTESDILIGEMFYPGGGKQQREALAAGTVVLTNNDSRYETHLPGQVPFVHADYSNIYEVLKNTIENYEFRQEMAKKGRPYVEEYNNINTVCKQIIDGLNGINEQQFIKPIFFREKFIPEWEGNLHIYNRWTAYVKDCDWYKQYVPSGERNGLIF